MIYSNVSNKCSTYIDWTIYDPENREIFLPLLEKVVHFTALINWIIKCVWEFTAEQWAKRVDESWGKKKDIKDAFV